MSEIDKDFSTNPLKQTPPEKEPGGKSDPLQDEVRNGVKEAVAETNLPKGITRFRDKENFDRNYGSDSRDCSTGSFQDSIDYQGRGDSTPFMKEPSYTVDSSVLKEAKQLTEQGLDSRHFIGTNSSALAGIKRAGFKLLSSRKVIEMQGHLRAGEKTSQGGSGSSSHIHGATGISGLGTALSYAYGREVFVDLSQYSAEELMAINSHLNSLQAQAASLDIGYVKACVDPLNDDHMDKPDTAVRHDFVERIQEWKESIYFETQAKAKMQSDKRFSILWGLDCKGQVVSLGGRPESGELAGEVMLSSEIDLKSGVLKEIFVPRENIEDAKAFLRSMGIEGEVKIHTIEALTYAVVNGDQDSKDSFEETMHLQFVNTHRHTITLSNLLQNQ